MGRFAYGAQLTPSLIAEVTGASPASIKNRVHRAKASGNPEDGSVSRASSVRHAKSVLRTAPLEEVERIINDLPEDRRVQIHSALADVPYARGPVDEKTQRESEAAIAPMRPPLAVCDALRPALAPDRSIAVWLSQLSARKTKGGPVRRRSNGSEADSHVSIRSAAVYAPSQRVSNRFHSPLRTRRNALYDKLGSGGLIICGLSLSRPPVGYAARLLPPPGARVERSCVAGAPTPST